MRLFLLSLTTLLLALTVRPGPEAALPATPIASVPQNVEIRSSEPVEPWYTPVPEDFRSSYDQDTTNRGKQTWDDYWRWVKIFYEGNILSQGWTSRSKALLVELKPGSEQDQLRAAINAVGKEIGGEWAKDGRVRNVSTADLLAWGKILENARVEADGSCAKLRRAIESIRDENRRRNEAGGRAKAR